MWFPVWAFLLLGTKSGPKNLSPPVCVPHLNCGDVSFDLLVAPSHLGGMCLMDVSVPAALSGDFLCCFLPHPWLIYTLAAFPSVLWFQMSLSFINGGIFLPFFKKWFWRREEVLILACQISGFLYALPMDFSYVTLSLQAIFRLLCLNCSSIIIHRIVFSPEFEFWFLHTVLISSPCILDWHLKFSWSKTKPLFFSLPSLACQANVLYIIIELSQGFPEANCSISICLDEVLHGAY